MSKVQQCAKTLCFEFIFRDDGGFDSDISRDESRKVIKSIEHRRITDRSVFDDLGEPLVEFTLWQATQRVGIRNHKPWLMEGSDEILTPGGIDSGLSANRAVHLRNDGGGNLNVRNTAVINGSRKTRQVTNNSAAKCHKE